MAYDLSNFKKKAEEVKDWLKKEFSTIRTGRATITLLDGVMVDSYGVKTPLNQTSNIVVEDSRSIKVNPWDKSLITSIEKAISVADLGVSTSVDGEGVRVIFPELTGENRERLVKQSKVKVEEAKVSLRSHRGKAISDIQDSLNSEDDQKREKDNVQKIVDETSKALDEMLKAKEKEILS